MIGKPRTCTECRVPFHRPDRWRTKCLHCEPDEGLEAKRHLEGVGEAVLKGQYRRGRKAGVLVDWTEADGAKALEFFGHKCAYCRGEMDPVSWDHVMPISRGGGTVPENMVPACVSCNSSKKDQTPKEWMGNAYPRWEVWLIDYRKRVRLVVPVSGRKNRTFGPFRHTQNRGKNRGNLEVQRAVFGRVLRY